VFDEGSSVVRKTFGAIIGFAILFGLLPAIAFYNWSTSAGISQAEYQALAELRHRVATVDDLEQRDILSEEIAEAERRRYLAKAQTTLSESHIQALIEVKYKVATVDDLEQRGILSEEVARAEKQRYLIEAQNIVEGTLNPNQLASLIKHLDSSQVIETQQTAQNSGRLSAPAITRLVLGLALVIVAGWLIQPYLASVRKRLLSRRTPLHAPTPSPRAVEAEAGFGEQLDTEEHTPPQLQVKPSTPPAALSSESSDSQPSFAESLTRRELEVLALVAEGFTNREIAQKLIITPGTAKVHISNIYSKLCVNRRVQAVTKAQELGILPSEQ
jgi:DNA-binding CsgD family transcriptional regulator